MNRKTKRTVTLLVVIILCMVSTCVLAVIAFFRSRQVQQFERASASKSAGQESEENELFWNGDEALLTEDGIVVFDVRYTDADTEILLSLAASIEEEMQGKDIQPVFLGAETDSELRSTILKCEEMDLYIGLCVGWEENDSAMFGTKCFYNDAYYTPDYNNVWLSDRLLQNVVTAISGKALGMENCGERDILVGLNVPASLLQLGYLTNAEEGELLKEPEYLRKIAGGIVETVEEYYEGR
ncbi:MAG: N-acetylmuramoyl-L-alanine amidase [Lachnospiraceae bacterium]|nr:N-acetylmuramoyl-L-alanine amidase [Lachnospiraceae bacterium]